VWVGEDHTPHGSDSSGTSITRIAKVVSLALMLGYNNEAGFTFSSHHNICVLPHKRFVRFRDRDNLAFEVAHLTRFLKFWIATLFMIGVVLK
jgi:hypothetical protein